MVSSFIGFFCRLQNRFLTKKNPLPRPPPHWMREWVVWKSDPDPNNVSFDFFCEFQLNTMEKIWREGRKGKKRLPSYFTLEEISFYMNECKFILRWIFFFLSNFMYRNLCWWSHNVKTSKAESHIQPGTELESEWKIWIPDKKEEKKNWAQN